MLILFAFLATHITASLSVKCSKAQVFMGTSLEADDAVFKNNTALKTLTWYPSPADATAADPNWRLSPTIDCTGFTVQCTKFSCDGKNLNNCGLLKQTCTGSDTCNANTGTCDQPQGPTQACNYGQKQCFGNNILWFCSGETGWNIINDCGAQGLTCCSNVCDSPENC